MNKNLLFKNADQQLYQRVRRQRSKSDVQIMIEKAKVSGNNREYRNLIRERITVLSKRNAKKIKYAPKPIVAPVKVSFFRKLFNTIIPTS